MKKDTKDTTGSYIWGFHDETPSERKLAVALKKAGLKFGQEVPVKGFTVDFLLDEWLIVEVDGESHLVSGRAEKDASRQKALEAAGFTVMRIPAIELSADHGVRRWINAIKAKVDGGPPYMARQSFENSDYKRQIEQIRKALEAGEAERRRREALALRALSNERQRARGRDGGPEESMEDYFGKRGQDFESMLDKYDSSRAPAKDDGDAGGKPRRTGKPK